METKTEQKLAETVESMMNLLVKVRDECGWSGVVYIIENAVLRLSVEEWVRKAPTSVGRLKRLWRTLDLSE